jgi:hypothetical protein
VSSNPKWGFEFTGSVSAFRRLMHGIPRTCALGVSLQRNRRVPQMYPHDVVAAGGRCWTLMDETAAYKCEARANALDVGGRLRTSLDGSRAGFEIDRKFLSALVLQACVEANTPSNTPASQAAMAGTDSPAWRSSGTISTEEAVPGFMDSSTSRSARTSALCGCGSRWASKRWTAPGAFRHPMHGYVDALVMYQRLSE